MVAYLEHANLTVPDVDAAIAFLEVVEPAFTVRRDERPKGSYRWAHVGDERCYIALQEPHPDSAPGDPRRPYKDLGVNHIGWVVEDLDAVVKRLEDAGYRRGLPVAPHPHRKRAYFHDAAGLEWELVEYTSDDPAERHAYD